MSRTPTDSMPATEVLPATDAAFATMVARLSHLSVGRGVDAYRDVDWDDPDLAVDPTDPRFALSPIDPFGATDWYRAQPPDVQARIGLVRMASCLRTGWQFENLLQQGLLHRALHLRAGSPEFRYSHHEIIEESQHTLMFEEFVVRSGTGVRGMPRWLRRAVEVILPPIAEWAPALFFVMVLGGEDPIDHLQRLMLAEGGGHPLLERIMRIHIAEEARHLSFARAALKRDVPTLGRARRELLSVLAPLVLGIMVRLMIEPTTDVIRRGDAPRSVVRGAFATPAGRALRTASVAKPRRLLRELGAITPAGRLVWKAFGIWDPDA